MNIKDFLQQSVNGQLEVYEQENFLKEKSELNSDEIVDVVRFLLDQMAYKIDLVNGVDICGTGGSGLPRINTSTISAFVLAALDVQIAKHGNKAASGRFGSFDLIESLGIKIPDNVDDIQSQYISENLTFLFAPFFHPVMRFFGEVRKKIGKPTFFNILGPLLSPVQVKRQIIGTTFKDKIDLIAESCIKLGREKVYIVCGDDSLDEVTLTGKTEIVEVENGKIKKYSVTPEDFGVQSCEFEEIQGGDKEFNTKIALDILKGDCESRHLDLVLINCALVLKLVDKVGSLKEGYELAKLATQSGKAYRKYKAFVEDKGNVLDEIVQNKKEEVEQRKIKTPIEEIRKCLQPSNRDLKKALQKEGTSIVAEIKQASPSAGKIFQGNFSPKEIAKKYETAEVDAISVLCDEKFFRGSLNHLKDVSETVSTPLLCKDFIIDEYQIYEARKFGADAILLIASILTQDQLTDFMKIAKSLKMDTLCEVRNGKEIDECFKAGANIIGINNRNLKTFKVDLGTTKKLVKYIDSCLCNKFPAKSQNDIVIISESGIKTRKDIDFLPSSVDAVLVGTSIMKNPDPASKIQELKNPKRKMLKICGIRSLKEAQFCEDVGVEFIGLNFVPTSKRLISVETANEICQNTDKLIKVGIFQNQDLDFVNDIAQKLNLDYIQLSGDEDLDYIQECKKPVIKTVAIKNKEDLKTAEKYVLNCALILLDGPEPGSGISFDHAMLKEVDFPFMIAGGINPDNIHRVLNSNPYVIDVASGSEENGKKSFDKIKLLKNLIK